MPDRSLTPIRPAKPADPITLYALAQALMALDTPEHRQEADTCLTRALALGPPPDLAERLGQTHSRLAHQVLRANAASQPRMDVVAYCTTIPSLLGCSSLCRGRMRGLIFRGSLRWRGGWWEVRPEAGE